MTYVILTVLALFIAGLFGSTYLILRENGGLANMRKTARILSITVRRRTYWFWRRAKSTVIWRQLVSTWKKPLSDSELWRLSKVIWKPVVALTLIVLLIAWAYPTLSNFQFSWGNTLWWVGITLCLSIGFLLLGVSLLTRIHEKRIREEKRAGAHKVAKVMFYIGTILLIAGVGMFLRNFVVEGYRIAWNSLAKVSLGSFWTTWQRELVLVGVGLLVLVLVIFVVTWKQFSGRSVKVPKYLKVALGITAGFALLHLFVWLFFSPVWESWYSQTRLFWTINAGVATVLFLSFSEIPRGKLVATALSAVVLVGIWFNLPDNVKPRFVWNSRSTAAVYVPKKKEEWVAAVFPGRVPGLVEKADLSPSYTLEIRNLVQVGDTLYYDIWPKEGGNKRIGWAKLRKSESSDRFFGTSYREETEREGGVWLELNESCDYEGEAWWFQDGMEIRVPMEIRKKKSSPAHRCARGFTFYKTKTAPNFEAVFEVKSIFRFKELFPLGEQHQTFQG